MSNDPERGSDRDEAVEEATIESVPNDNNRLNYEGFKTYSITWQSKFTFRGRRSYYQFYYDGRPLFHSKIKRPFSGGPVPIAEGVEAHFSSKESAGFIYCGDDGKSFSLKRHTLFGDEVMNITFSHIDYAHPRYMVVNLLHSPDQEPTVLTTMKPKYDPRGFYYLPTSDKISIPSVKNCILSLKDTDEPQIMVRRVNKDMIEIDSKEEYEPIVLFALLIAICITNC